MLKEWLIGLVMIRASLEQVYFLGIGKEMQGTLPGSVSSCDILEEDGPSSTDQLCAEKEEGFAHIFFPERAGCFIMVPEKSTNE